VGILGKTCCSCKTTENQQQRENQNTKIHKQTTKQENQIIITQTKNQNLGKQAQPSCVNNGSMYNRVKVWNEDGYGRREYILREMCNLKKSGL